MKENIRTGVVEGESPKVGDKKRTLRDNATACTSKIGAVNRRVLSDGGGVEESMIRDKGFSSCGCAIRGRRT